MKLEKMYRELMESVIDAPIEKNARTGENIKVIEYPVNLTLDLRNQTVPTIGLRKTFPKSAAAEIAWFFQGKQESSFIEKHDPFWDKFIEDIETENGTIKGVNYSAINYRAFFFGEVDSNSKLSKFNFLG